MLDSIEKSYSILTPRGNAGLYSALFCPARKFPSREAFPIGEKVC